MTPRAVAASFPTSPGGLRPSRSGRLEYEDIPDRKLFLRDYNAPAACTMDSNPASARQTTGKSTSTPASINDVAMR